MFRLILLITVLLQIMTCTAFAYKTNGANVDFGGFYKMKLPNNLQRQLTYYPGYLHINGTVFDMVEIRDIDSHESDSEELVAVGTVRENDNGQLVLTIDFGAEVKSSCDHNCGTKRKYINNQNYSQYEISGGEGTLLLKPLNSEGGLPLVMSAEGTYSRLEQQLYALTDMVTLYALESILGAEYPEWVMQARNNRYQYQIDWAFDEFFSKMTAKEQAAGRNYNGGMVITVFDEQGAVVDRLTTDAFAEHIYRIDNDRQLSLVVDRTIE